ncbi:EF-hand domain-containing protein [uncultured Phenylobacterium sp.]|uniref:EF-hand domain-containing protein n=1 Tax=uncultured Phenylobacterium sp. TaxID=349273 RepID=UPI0025D805AC|nr:EF-hand domain-containing protein [uncultured Phenylobacterium sp.]
MPEPRKLKKSESLEIRIPHPTKLAFMARCREEGRSASEALRAFIDGQLAAPQPQPRRRTWRLVAACAIAAAVGAAAVPSLARPGLRAAEFARLDANRDGVISYAEFQRP